MIHQVYYVTEDGYVFHEPPQGFGTYKTVLTSQTISSVYASLSYREWKGLMHYLATERDKQS